MRIYTDNNVRSISQNWVSERKAREAVVCYKALFKYYSTLFQENAPLCFKLKKMKFALYLKLAREKGYMNEFRKAFSLKLPIHSAVSLILLILPVKLTRTLLIKLKSKGVLRRYG